MAAQNGPEDRVGENMKHGSSWRESEAFGPSRKNVAPGGPLSICLLPECIKMMWQGWDQLWRECPPNSQTASMCRISSPWYKTYHYMKNSNKPKWKHVFQIVFFVCKGLNPNLRRVEWLKEWKPLGVFTWYDTYITLWMTARPVWSGLPKAHGDRPSILNILHDLSLCNFLCFMKTNA